MTTVNESSLIWEHQSRILALETGLKNMKDVSEDVAVIKNDINYIKKSIDIFVAGVEKMDDRVTCCENDNAKQGERISNITVGQTIFTMVIGTVATFFGVTR